MAYSREDRIKKILALLNLADNNSSDHQGDQARKAAKALMSKYSVTKGDLESAEYKNKRIEIEYKSCPEWYKRIWFEVGELLGLYVVYIKTGRGRQAKFHVTGPEEEITHLDYIAHALHNQINALAYKYFYARPDMDRAERMPYRNGLSVRAIERLAEIIADVYRFDDSMGFEDNQMMDQGRALVLIEDKVKVCKSHSTVGKTTTSCTSMRADGQGYNQGYNDGDSLGLNKGVNSGFKPKQLG
ncbi:MAG: DUF2786 domain-containing protein [Ketobacter sp.]|nr:DUF2786 domain-containing protein [Ketobacter sp.]